MSKFSQTFLKSLNEEASGKPVPFVAKKKKASTAPASAFSVNEGKKAKGKKKADKGRKKVVFSIATKVSKLARESVLKESVTPGQAIKVVAGRFAGKIAKIAAVFDEYLHAFIDGQKVMLGWNDIQQPAAVHEDAPPPADMAPAPQEAAPAEEPSDEDTWKNSLDKGTNPDDFNVDDNPQLNVDTAGLEAARDWIGKLEAMAEFVNGTGPDSLNTKINELEMKNSVPFRGVVRREEKRITKLAENLRGLAEVFKSVVIGSSKKIKDANTR